MGLPVNDEGVMKTEDDSLLIVLEFGVENFPAICEFREMFSGWEGEGWVSEVV